MDAEANPGNTSASVDSVAPLLVYENIDTPDYLTSFKIDDNFRLAFNEKVMAGDGEIVISNGVDTRNVAIDDANQVTFDELGSVTIDLTEDLVAGTTYQVQMENGVIIDTAGNPFAGFNISGAETKTSAPTLYSINVLDGSVFKTDGKIALNFDEKVIAGSGDIIFSNSSETLTIPVNDTSQVIFDETGLVIIDPSKDLIADSTYTIQLGEGLITDSTGNPFEGFGDISLTTTGSAPLLLASSPSNGAQTKAEGEIILLFDEKVKAGSGDIVFSNGTDNRIIAINDTSQVSFDDLGGVVIELAENLIAGATYSVQMANGVILDTTGNSYTGFNDANISVIDSDPLLLTSNPTNGSMLKSDDKISLYFDEKVEAGSGNIVLSNGVDTRIVAIDDASQVTFDEFGGVFIDLAEDLIAGTAYSVQIANGVILDSEDNAYTGFSDAIIEAITSNPFLQSSGIRNNEFVLRFDEQVKPGDGNIYISNGADTRIIATKDSSQVTFDETGVVIIDPVTDLSNNTVYSLQIEGGAIVDTEDNPYVDAFADSSLIPLVEFIRFEQGMIIGSV